jgi:endo-1,4-beta-xylanase
MKKTHISVLLLLCSIVMATGANVNIAGTVTKTGGGPLNGVTISLAGVPDMVVTTDSDGKFALLSTSSVFEMNASKSTPLKFMLSGRDVVFSSASGKLSGNATVFSGNGRQLVSMDFTDLMSSTQRLTLPVLSPGLNILRITANNNTYSGLIIQVGHNLYLKESGSTGSNNLRLAKSMADSIADTLIAKKAGYLDKKTPIKSYTLSNLAITLDSVAAKVCNATTLKEAGACGNHEILMGTAVSPSKLIDLVSREFNYVTPENEMKWQNLQGSEGSFNFSPADQIVNWAGQKNIKVKGHCLVWHSQLAGWVNQAKGRDRVLAIMKKHIETVMGHFGSKVYAWDVVNEAIATDSDVGSGNARMRSTVFYNEIGPDYIEQAFKIARDYADSHNMKEMKLYYNDYSIDADNDKSKFLRTVVKGWVDKKVPVDGIGFQMHLGPPNNIATTAMVEDNMKYYTDLGLEVLISEWDINLCGSKITKAQQLELYHDITKVCVNNPKCVAITVWGVNDGDSWLNSWSGALCNGSSSQSLLFNNGQKKDTYTQVLNALNGK